MLKDRGCNSRISQMIKRTGFRTHSHFKSPPLCVCHKTQTQAFTLQRLAQYEAELFTSENITFDVNSAAY